MDLVAYLAQLPPIKLTSLYESPYTCQAVMRSLPPLAKQYVVRLLFLDAGVPRGEGNRARNIVDCARPCLRIRIAYQGHRLT